MVIIKKNDLIIRICIKHRKMNDITVTDAEHIPSADEHITVITSSSMCFQIRHYKGVLSNSHDTPLGVLWDSYQTL